MTFDYNLLKKKVRDTWLAKCISGNIGFNQECYKEIFDFKHIEDFAPTEMYANDDLDIQLAWLDLLLERGMSFEAQDLLEKFIDCYHFDFSEYGYAKRNYKRGIMPPMSGKYNNYFSECMGCPIRSEVWALVTCGDTEKAVELARLDGMIDHSEESIFAEQWIVAMESLAFRTNDLRTIIDSALEYIPSSSLIYKVVKEVLLRFDAKKTWLSVAQYLHNTFGSCDGTYAVINMGILTAGLVYGGDDFDKLMTLTLNGGYDTDCTCATAGAIYGLLYGIDKIDPKWINMADTTIVTAVKNLNNSFSNFDELTYATMRVLIDCVNSGAVKDVEVANITDEFLPITSKKATVKVAVNYPQGVELYLGKIITANVTITNLLDTSQEFSVKSEFPPSLAVKSDIMASFVIMPRQSLSYNIEVSLAHLISRIPDSNVITLTLSSKQGVKTEKIGFVGAPIYRLSAVFADGFDMNGKEDLSTLSPELIREWGGKKYLYHMDCNEYTNNWLRYDHQYIPENWDSAYFNERYNNFQSYHAREDFIKVDDIYRHKGPCVVYALQKLYREKDSLVEFHIGSSDPYKMWVNGVLVSEQKKSWYFSPYNQRPRVRLKSGENQIVIKLLRNGEKQKFSYILRNEPYNHVGEIDTNSEFII